MDHFFFWGEGGITIISDGVSFIESLISVPNKQTLWQGEKMSTKNIDDIIVKFKPIAGAEAFGARWLSVQGEVHV